MSKKSILIVSDDSQSELSRSFERSLKNLLDEQYVIQAKGIGESYSLVPDALLVLGADPTPSSDTKGVNFLRTYWAGIINKTDQKAPPAIILSYNTLQELIQNDMRCFALCSKGVALVTVPFSIKDIAKKIEKNLNKRIEPEAIRDYLKSSCELRLGGIIEHARRNFIGPYSLLIGARYVNDIDSGTYEGVLNKLRNKEAKEEIFIYDATVRGAIEEGTVESSQEKPLSEIVKGKKILLVDDECTSAGWEETMNAIFGNNVLTAIGESDTGRKWQNADDVLSDPRIKNALEPDNHLIKYDLILLDLYLTKEDEEKKKGGGSQQHYKFSGLKLLEAIRKNDASVPVILFTASNKAFNVKAAEGLGIDGYFQKEGRYHSKDEAERYYRQFKSLIEKCISQERRILRDIRNGIETYKESPEVDEEKKNEVVQFLETGLSSLTGYFKERESNVSYLIGVLILLDQIIQLVWNKELKNEEGYGKYSYVYNPSRMDIALTRKNIESKQPIYAFIVRQLRHSAAHPEDLRYTDAIFAFFAIFMALGIENIDTWWEDPCPNLQFDESTVKEMIKSICTKACSKTCKTRDSFACDPSKPGFNKKAMFLTLEDNLQTPESRKSQILFRYLFFVLCLSRLNIEIPPFFLNLIKERLCTAGNKKIFCPPFKDDCWVGIKMSDGCIDSPLGILKERMYKDIRYEGDKVLFQLTKNYLRG